VAKAHQLAMQNLINSPLQTLEVLNVASGFGTSVLQLIKEFEYELGRRIDLVKKPQGEGDPKSSIGFIGNTKSILNWHPKMCISENVNSSLQQ
jgi:UDP-glucose 4-epimerase